MGFPHRLLTEDEEIVLELRPHWVALAGPAFWTAIAITLVVLVVVYDPPWQVAALPVLGWIPLGGVPYLQWRYTQFVLTNERVISRSGVIAKASKEIPLETVNDVTFKQSVLERLLNAGDLVIESAGESGQNRFTNVRRPEQVQLEVYRASEVRKGLHDDDRPASVADEIAKLAELRDRGILTDEEFDTRKRSLLS